MSGISLQVLGIGDDLIKIFLRKKVPILIFFPHTEFQKVHGSPELEVQRGKGDFQETPHPRKGKGPHAKVETTRPRGNEGVPGHGKKVQPR